MNSTAMNGICMTTMKNGDAKCREYQECYCPAFQVLANAFDDGPRLKASERITNARHVMFRNESMSLCSWPLRPNLSFAAYTLSEKAL